MMVVWIGTVECCAKIAMTILPNAPAVKNSLREGDPAWRKFFCFGIASIPKQRGKKAPQDRWKRSFETRRCVVR
jgi:hypothetical protein